MNAVSDQQAEAHRRHVENSFRNDKAHWEEEIWGWKERQNHEGEALFINMEKLSIIQMLFNYSQMVQEGDVVTVEFFSWINKLFMGLYKFTLGGGLKREILLNLLWELKSKKIF